MELWSYMEYGWWGGAEGYWNRLSHPDPEANLLLAMGKVWGGVGGPWGWKGKEV